MKLALIAASIALSYTFAFAEPVSPLENAKTSMQKRVEYLNEKYSKNFGGPIQIQVDWAGFEKFCKGHWKVKSECNGSGIVDYQIGNAVERLRSAQRQCGGALSDRARTIAVKFEGTNDSEVVVTDTTVIRHPVALANYKTVTTPKTEDLAKFCK